MAGAPCKAREAFTVATATSLKGCARPVPGHGLDPKTYVDALLALNNLNGTVGNLHVARLDAMNESVAEQVMFFEFAFCQARREVGAVNRDVKLFEDVR